jgi:hypothetical protein
MSRFIFNRLHFSFSGLDGCALWLLVVLTGAPALAQRAPITISGKVVSSEDKKPIPGAGVLKWGTTSGRTADSLGRFTYVINPDDTLLIRAIGYKPQLYVPTSRTASELRPIIELEVDPVYLKEVQIGNRPSPEKIRTALNNMKRKQLEAAKNPNPTPILPPVEVKEAAPATISSPATALYEAFNKREREKKALDRILKAVEAQEAAKREAGKRAAYERLFKDNTGYR